jgi:hypothetical protein
VILQRASYTRKIDQLIIDCKDGKSNTTRCNMSKKILLDKISIPGIKPMKYTVKTVVTLQWKKESNDSDEVVEQVNLTSVGRGGAGFLPD